MSLGARPRAEVVRRIRGLYGIADATTGDPVRLGTAMLVGGCRLIQLRAKGWTAKALLAAARELRVSCDAVGATLIINDDAEVAAAANADGVHVGPTDADLATARSIIGPDRIIGRSTNDPTQIALVLGDADYLAFGPLWNTPHLSRPKAVQGLEALAIARQLVPAGVPLVAIGGITPSRLDAVRAAGVDAWAVIGAIAGAPDPVGATRALLGPTAPRNPRGR